MPRAKKAAIYCRVSTIHQVDKDSLPMQRSDMINYAKYALSIENYEIFEDAGYSGKNTDRPAYQEMMERIKEGEFTHVLVWKIDRVSRNLLDFASMYAECKNLGVTFVSKNEQFDTSTAMGEAMLKIVLVFAELERNMTSERVMSTMNARAAEGKWNGGRVPFGYRYDKETDSFSIREDEAKVVHEMKNIYLRLHSITGTAHELNAIGRRTRRGYGWTPQTVAIILRSPFYRGTYRYNYRNESKGTFTFKDQKDWVMCSKHHEALFTQEEYDNIDYWLTKNRRLNGKTTHTQRKNIHIFAGLIKCGNCGDNYFASLSRTLASGYRPSMYQCSGRRQKALCDNKYVTDVTVGNFVFNYISNMMELKKSFTPRWQTRRISSTLLRGDVFHEIKSIAPATLDGLRTTLIHNLTGTTEYKPMVKGHGSVMAARKDENLQAELDKNERALDRLKSLFLYADDAMSQTEFLQQKKSLENNIARIQGELDAIRSDSIFATNLSEEVFVQKAAQFFMNTALQKGRIDFEQLATQTDAALLKDFVNAIVSRISVRNGRIIELEFTNGQIHRFEYSL